MIFKKVLIVVNAIIVLLSFLGILYLSKLINKGVILDKNNENTTWIEEASDLNKLKCITKKYLSESVDLNHTLYQGALAQRKILVVYLFVIVFNVIFLVAFRVKTKNDK